MGSSEPRAVRGSGTNSSEPRDHCSPLPTPYSRSEATHEDIEAVASQLGREPTVSFRVAARCPAGHPSVIENERGRSMPTTFWVTCPSLRAAISRVEAAGGVRAAQKEIGARVVDAVHAEHLVSYGTRVAGIGDPASGDPAGRVKCLHAFVALHLAGALPNPVAEWTLARLGDEPYADPARCPGCAKRLEDAELPG